MRPPTRFPRLVAVLAAAALALTSCTAPRPQVTFFGNRSSATAAPELWCEADTATLKVTCPAQPDTGNDARLTLRANQPLQINVPGDVASGPWLVVFEYRDAGGTPQNGRSEVFSDDRLAYTLPALGAGSQLTRVEVQAALVPTLATDGSTVFTALHTWALVVTAASPADPTAPASP